MQENAGAEQAKTDELAAAIRDIRERVRSRHPQGTLQAGIEIPALMPILHARDAADAKVAAIGSVNPRPGGLLNSAVQAAKKLVARALDWHVREQVEFNRAVMSCVQAMLETFEANNRALSQMAGYVQSEIGSLRAEVGRHADAMNAAVTESKDVRAHWSQWREAWEEKLNRGEVYMLRTISELNASFQHRATLTEASFRQSMTEQHSAFQGALAKTTADIQQRLWDDLRNIRAEYERLIYDELRVTRQRAAAHTGAAPRPNIAIEQPVQLDWLRFANRFRGSEESIRAAQTVYTDYFAGATDVLDIGCGRGEFLEAAKAAGIGARGIDLNQEAVEICRGKGLDAEAADLFDYLHGQPDRSLGGIYCAQVIEHLSPASVPELIRLAAAKLRPGAGVVFETPNPECLAIFATHFYLDPTHTRPVPAPLLVFYLEEAGFGQIEVKRMSPAVESMPSIDELPPAFRDAFFGGLDYAVLARKL
jgi:2-polyprenyl-3-methyl-5-hydroxy-6-metoxy-1,4-benzoquinol methylase